MENTLLKDMFRDEIISRFDELVKTQTDDEYNAVLRQLLELDEHYMEHVKHDDDLEEAEKERKIKVDQVRQKDAELAIRRDEQKMAAEKIKTEKAKIEADVAVEERKLALEENESARNEQFRLKELELKNSELEIRRAEVLDQKNEHESEHKDASKERLIKRLEIYGKVFLGVLEATSTVAGIVVAFIVNQQALKFEYIDSGMVTTQTGKNITKIINDYLRK